MNLYVQEKERGEIFNESMNYLNQSDVGNNADWNFKTFKDCDEDENNNFIFYIN